jgi:hypothetical protein
MLFTFVSISDLVYTEISLFTVITVPLFVTSVTTLPTPTDYMFVALPASRASTLSVKSSSN